MALCWIRLRVPRGMESFFTTDAGEKPTRRILVVTATSRAHPRLSSAITLLFKLHAHGSMSSVIETSTARILAGGSHGLVLDKKTCWMHSSTPIKKQLKPFLPSESISFCSIKFGMLNCIANNAAAAGQKATRGIFIFAATSKAHPRFQAIRK
uniref:Uncharacterized protein n=1 Tax=Cucumis sativus TaxID=3659 RepID=A0A0A0KVT1_CUCSA